MKQKLLTTIVSLVSVAILSLGLSSNANVAMAQKSGYKDYRGLQFTGIQVSSAFQVELKKSRVNLVSVEINPDYMRYINIEAEAGILKMKMTDDLPRKLQRIQNPIKVIIQTPVINYIYLSGASTLTSSDTFDLGMNELRVTLKSASKIHTLHINAIDASFDLSSASRADITGEFGDCEIELASASRLTIQGSVNNLDVKATSASYLEAFQLVAEDAEIDLSSASKAEVNVKNTLELKATGASKCTYKEYDSTRIHPELVGASTVKSF